MVEGRAYTWLKPSWAASDKLLQPPDYFQKEIKIKKANDSSKGIPLGY